jgi:hypothetical protein
MKCELCGRKVRGDLEVSDGQLPDGTGIVLITSTPDRDWIMCDSCGRLVCHDCCEHPKTGFCDGCIAKYDLFDVQFVESCPVEDLDDFLIAKRAARYSVRKRLRFTESEAEAKIGKTVRSLVNFSGVPKGTTGRVVAKDDMGDGWDAVIEWDLPQPKASRRESEVAGEPVTIVTKGDPLRDWFPRDEYEQYLVELP